MPVIRGATCVRLGTPNRSCVRSAPAPNGSSPSSPSPPLGVLSTTTRAQTRSSRWTERHAAGATRSPRDTRPRSRADLSKQPTTQSDGTDASRPSHDGSADSDSARCFPRGNPTADCSPLTNLAEIRSASSRFAAMGEPQRLQPPDHAEPLGRCCCRHDPSPVGVGRTARRAGGYRRTCDGAAAR